MAPTYTYNAFDGADWRDSVSKAAADLGREDQWQEWEEEYQARVDEVRARLDEEGIDPVVASISFWNDKVNIGCTGVPCLVFADLGLKIAPQANATEDGLQDGEAPELSVEELGTLEGIDVVFDSADEDGVMSLNEEQLTRNPLWQNLPFVKDDQIYAYNMEMQYGSPSGQMAFLEVVEKPLLGGN
ncbi:ABC transporter substrate-binding protein [Corynebacterium sputi]|uniref:ABC transporter substrate-binding protein n=1 Tax=Corynebacterium sputi TaxID=489915 RepID=UPI001F0B1A55|nr:ABC transporter substrate-binding protein [Corynebacterium sputi]